MIVDVHTHIFPPEFIRRREKLVREDRWFGTLYANPRSRMVGASRLLGSMARSGVSHSVVFSFPWADRGRLREANDYLFDSADKSEGKLLPFVMADPHDMKFSQKEVERFLARKVRGIGELMPEGQSFSFDDPARTEGIMKLAQAHGLFVHIHTNEPVGHEYPGKHSVRLDVICRWAEKFPEVKIICGHWGGGLIFYELMPEVRDALRHVYYDSAASSLLYRDRVLSVAAGIAPRKILFGTDYPLIRQSGLLKRVEAEMKNAPLRDFLGGNARRLFKLRDAEDPPKRETQLALFGKGR
jgi:hypothetical protein